MQHFIKFYKYYFKPLSQYISKYYFTSSKIRFNRNSYRISQERLKEKNKMSTSIMLIQHTKAMDFPVEYLIFQV